MQKSVVWHLTEKELFVNNTIKSMVGILSFLILTSVGAFVYIPLVYTPVPVTLQTFFVLLSAAFLKKRDALLTQGLYAGLGTIGLPIFSAGQGGLLKLFGPTGGYIFGFIIAVLVVSTILDFYRQKERLVFLSIVLAMSCGILTIYFFGALWLFLFMHFSLTRALILGVVPFIFGDILKVVSAAYFYQQLKARPR